MNDKDLKKILKAQSLLCAEAAMRVIESKGVSRKGSITMEIWAAILNAGSEKK
jgi:hypothetical protein